MIGIFLAASYIHVCGRRDPNLDQCIVDSVKNMKSKMCAGIPELSVPSIDPVNIKKITILDSPSSKLYLRDITIVGLCDYDVSFFHIDLEQNHFDINMLFKHIEINVTYDLSMHILVPIAQKGKALITTGMYEISLVSFEKTTSAWEIFLRFRRSEIVLSELLCFRVSLQITQTRRRAWT